MEKDPYKKYRRYQRDTAKSERTGGGMGWDECVNKYCPMCAGAVSLLEVSANEDCNKCKETYWTQIRQCAGESGGVGSTESGGDGN
jgi:hypothetical protein